MGVSGEITQDGETTTPQSLVGFSLGAACAVPTRTLSSGILADAHSTHSRSVYSYWWDGVIWLPYIV